MSVVQNDVVEVLLLVLLCRVEEEHLNGPLEKIVFVVGSINLKLPAVGFDYLRCCSVRIPALPGVEREPGAGEF